MGRWIVEQVSALWGGGETDGCSGEECGYAGTGSNKMGVIDLHHTLVRIQLTGWATRINLDSRETRKRNARMCAIATGSKRLSCKPVSD
ncbi:hypothetical protein DBV15_10013 [Temnothorax longispinosus]|uniref:Uncharacterized protein n=1 Tax=Temnothorax longispinosus TaxID=300112 RepID=A0A4S2KUM5_9HYME|nr:hypothetical protein DBV15_10013 [Temnothorax longispinosus]